MHLVFLNQYYPPDAAPTGVMLEAVVEELAAQGHEVTVLCAKGGYAEGKRETTELKTQEENEVGRDGFTHPSHLSPSARGEKDPAVAGRPAADEVGRLRKGEPTIVRIEATRFGRGTFLGKLADYLSYYLGVSWKLWWMRPRADRVVALTTPPLLSVLVRLITRLRGADHAHWVMDVYPDVMVAHGMVGENSTARRLLAGLARWGFNGDRCAAIVTLGPDMAERLARLSPASAQRDIIRWVPLWGTPLETSATVKNAGSPDPALALRRERGWKDREMVVMYSGNMGLGHRFGEILEVIRTWGAGDGSLSEGDEMVRDLSASAGNDPHRAPRQAAARFVFFGDGRRRGEIAEFIAAHPGGIAELHGYVGREQLAAHLQSADVHVVSLDPLWTGTMLPSKLQGIFAVARPVVFIGDTRSSLARWIEESGGGWVVKPGDVDGLRSAIQEALSTSTRRLRGRAAQAFAERHFDRETNARQVAMWLTKAL